VLGRGIIRRAAVGLEYAALRIRAARAAGDGRPVALIDLARPEATRRLAQLSAMLAAAGFSVRAATNFRQYRLMNRYGKNLFASGGALLRGPSRPDLLVTDGAAAGAGKTLRVDWNVFPAAPTGPYDLAVPIMFHPGLLDPETYREAAALAGRAERRMRCFFAGNVAEGTYSRPVRAGGADLLTRFSIAEALRADGLGALLEEPADYREFRDRLEAGAYADRFVLIDTSRFSVPADEWLQTLADADYFLAPPGYAQPFCHNIVEAMAVGTIPITQYGAFFSPPLRDGEECLAFDSLPALSAALRRVLAPGHRKGDLGVNAAAYHEERLSLGAAAARIRAFAADVEVREARIFLAGGAS
jgi:hypothetical protein